ncbi:MAG TPA: membrane dipeptidase, partial [Tahibacter sp.]|nr:membrane dipeptidase [Tahibacter sp.]
DRRRFLTLAAAAATVAAAPGAFAAEPAPSARWRNAIVVNALGALDNPNVDRPGTDPAGMQTGKRERLSLDARALGDAHASGLAAVNWTIGYVAGPGDPFERSVADIALYDRLIRDQSADLAKVLRAGDIARAKRERRIGVIYGFQNAVQIGTNLERVDVFADLGVRVVQLTYNPANPLGDGAMAPENRGLTPFGREVVARLNDNRVMVDLSHSGEHTCLDAARASTQPISINHTGCRALVDLPRNKTDAELKLVADRGGFVGIYFMPFLDAGGIVTADDVVAHIEHAVKVCGEDAVGIGTDGTVTAIDDLDGYRKTLAEAVEARRKAGIGAKGEGAHTLPFAIDLRGPTQYFDLADRLSQRGHGDARIEKILGGNFVRYATTVWGA